MKLVLGAALGLAGVLLVVFGRRGLVSSNGAKMRVLAELDGREVVLGVNGPGGRVELIVPRRGQLHVDDAGGRSVVLTGEKKDRLIFVEQIRWVEDPATGTRHGDRW